MDGFCLFFLFYFKFKPFFSSSFQFQLHKIQNWNFIFRYVFFLSILFDVKLSLYSPFRFAFKSVKLKKNSQFHIKIQLWNFFFFYFCLLIISLEFVTFIHTSGWCWIISNVNLILYERNRFVKIAFKSWIY